MKVRIIYSTTSGNTGIVAQAISQDLVASGISCALELAEKLPNLEMDREDILLLACATYGHGVLQGRMRSFVEGRAAQADLNGIKGVVVGLGDDKYDREYNIESAPILEQFIRNRGGSILMPALRINKDPLPQIDSVVRPWTKNLISQLMKIGSV